jgi:serine/threonine protein kinase
MTAVYLARRNSDGVLVAIKFVRDWHRRDPGRDRAVRPRGAHGRALDHPNIVRTVAVEAVDEQALAIVMQYVEGGTLRDALSEGRVRRGPRRAVLRDVAAALSYAHEHGVVHRDVKPENIFLDRTTGRALLSDFGIARSLEGDTALTATGSALGTPTYMSPEQIDGCRPDGRSDIYSLGSWVGAAGRPQAVGGENLYSVIYKQKREHLPRLTTLRDDVRRRCSTPSRARAEGPRDALGARGTSSSRSSERAADGRPGAVANAGGGAAAHTGAHVAARRLRTCARRAQRPLAPGAAAARGRLPAR